MQMELSLDISIWICSHEKESTAMLLALAYR